MSEPRGVPTDAGAWTEHASWDHSEGWLSLDEVIAFNWSQKTRKRGVIPLRKPKEDRPDRGHDSYEEWRLAKVCPSSYCGWVSGPGIVVVSEAEAELMLNEVDGAGTVYVQVQWTETYADCARDFLAFIDQMLKPLGDAQHTRLVFGFDS